MNNFSSKILTSEGHQKRFLMKSIAYLKVGRLLHFMSVIFLCLSIFPTLWAIDLFQAERWGLGLFIAWVASFFLTNAVLAEFDAWSRWQNYKQIKDQLFENGYRSLILIPVLKSRCQRDAALVAASELGYKEQVHRYYSAHGYQWHHIFPDFVFTYPSYLVTKHFWKTTFFANKYHSKYF